MTGLININLCLTVFACILFMNCNSAERKSNMKNSKPEYALVIHGGAGTITKENMSEEMEQKYRAALDTTLQIGKQVLASGGTSREAVLQCIKYMEDSPLFNAGKGSVFTHEGKHTLDASVMNGQDLKAGAVSGLMTIKNPIMAANAVLENSVHVLLSGKGAEEFCILQGLEQVDNSYFFTQNRYESLQRILEREQELGMNITDMADSKYGTVGAVALDKAGNIFAGTSTGGMTNKRYGRIGDSPIIGAGTYANNASCGVSCTGHGEYFIRYAVAHDLSAIMQYKEKALAEAADYIIHEKLKTAGGDGGLIALDANGNVAMPFNTEGMYRGFINDKEKYIGIYKED